MGRRFFAACLRARWGGKLFAALLLMSAVAGGGKLAATNGDALAADGGELRLATTTSIDNSGLLAFLIPDFESECDCRVRTIVAGSGQAIALGRRGDVDALLTHAPADEEQFAADGFASIRRAIMENNFVVVGPAKDPAALADAPNISAAFQKLAKGGARFISRGDNSGTHQKEKMLWAAAGESPAGEWYVKAGAGMGRTLLMADELRAYTLSDRGTYLAFRDKTALREVSRPQPLLKNPYTATAVNAARHPHVQEELARRFVEWLASAETQKRIGAYRYHGETLFFPSANGAP